MADIPILKDQAAAAGKRFQHLLENECLPGDWEVAAEDPRDQLERRALISDLVIPGQHDPDDPAGFKKPEDVILICGRPVLVVP